MANNIFSIRLVTILQSCNQRDLLVAMLQRCNGRVYAYLKIIIFCFLIFGISNISLSQIKPDTTKVPGDTTVLNYSREKEKLFENLQDDNEDSEFLDLLDFLETNPIDINSATLEDFGQLPMLSPIIAKNIIDYRNKHGGFKSKNELLNVEGFNNDLYESLKPYLVAKGAQKDVVITELGEVKKESINRKTDLIKGVDILIRSRFQQDLQTREGFLNGHYLGTKPKVYNQINFNYSAKTYKLEGNATMEKDAGEESLTDFSSGFAALKDFKFVENFVVGDYLLNFGQGLGMWSSLNLGKSSVDVTDMKRSSPELKGYRSVTESQFFRGAASQMRLNNLDLTVFFSNNYYDATIDTMLNDVSSLYFNGYHRTINEKNKAKNVTEKLVGGHLSYKNGSLNIGSTFWTSTFSKPFGTDSTKQLYSFTGTAANMISVDYDYIYRNINIYGEVARSQSGAVAGITGAQLFFNKIGSIVLLYRNYPQDFSPVHSFGFGEKNGNTQNERGFYAGITLRPLKGVIVNSYFDQFKFPYRSYFEPVPLQGNEFLTSVEWKAGKGLSFYLKYKNQNKEMTRTITDLSGMSLKQVDNQILTNVRAQINYDISGRVGVMGRFEYVNSRYDVFGGDSKGLMFLSNFNATIIDGLNISARVMYFQTDDYDSRVYEYESDIRGVYANTMLYGKGSRWYVMLRYKPWDFLELAAKYSETYIDGAKTIGTGDDTIFNDINNRLNIGLEITF